MKRRRKAAIAAAASLTMFVGACGAGGGAANDSNFAEQAPPASDYDLSELNGADANMVDMTRSADNAADAWDAGGEEAAPVPRKKRP